LSKETKYYEDNDYNNEKGLIYKKKIFWKRFKEGIIGMIGFSYPLNIKYSKINSTFLLICMAISFLIIIAFILTRIVDIYVDNDIINELYQLNFKGLQNIIISLFEVSRIFILFIVAIPTFLIGVGFILPVGCSLAFHIMFIFKNLEMKEKTVVTKKDRYEEKINNYEILINRHVLDICYYIFGIMKIEGDIMIKLKNIYVTSRNKLLKNSKDRIIWRIMQIIHSQ
jgi:hypothetical protein